MTDDARRASRGHVIKVPAMTHPTRCYTPQPLLAGMARCNLPKQHKGKHSWEK